MTEQIASRAIALPFFNRIQSDQIEEVCSTLTELSDFASQYGKEKRQSTQVANAIRRWMRFRRHQPQCIPNFVTDVVSSPEDRGPTLTKLLLHQKALLEESERVL